MYASDRAGSFDIWLQPVAGGEPVRLTNEPGNEENPVFSPDGNEIACQSEQGGRHLRDAGAGRALPTDSASWARSSAVTWSALPALLPLEVEPDGETAPAQKPSAANPGNGDSEFHLGRGTHRQRVEAKLGIRVSPRTVEKLLH